ncbi:DUF6745 domain-containing protein [Micromonospora sp. NPDC005806]|uniref:DUF6745 domain-containing protein n=1 Tax=Micromonospora sp. NPDC005806 TaxID=3364234 RepID=UPI0036A45CDD
MYDLVHCPICATMDPSITARYTMQPAWSWDAERSFVDQDDEGHAVLCYCLDHDDRFFAPAWCYHPDWVLLATIDTYREVLGTTPDLARERRRDVALAAGLWWPFEDVAVMSGRPTLLRVSADGQLHADREPAVVWPDGSQMWARDGVAIAPQ